MPPIRIVGFATRLTLLLVLLTGGRADCVATATPNPASDCHQADSGSPHHSPGAPAQQHHCAALHSCALDLSLAAATVHHDDRAPESQAFPARNNLRSNLTQLPEVPPPRA